MAASLRPRKLRARWLLLGLALACGQEPQPTRQAASRETVDEAGAGPETPAGAQYAGAEACAACHPAQTDRWRGSDHDRAMEEPSPSSLVAPFDASPLEVAGEHWSAISRDQRYFVRAPDGVEYAVAYTFGHDPLQQYLVRGERGRLQSLPLAWDSRDAAAGGQRWMHLYADAPPEPGEAIHWQGREQTWNFQCAECHSTALVRGYDAATDTYATRYAEIDVACEACHGPGSLHTAWAEQSPAERAGDAAKGLVVDLAGLRAPGLASGDGAWALAPGVDIATRDPAAPPRDTELAVCAPCHSRRAPLGDAPLPGALFLDGYRPALLEDRLYFADGQIRDEVYVWGSFVQSRMHAAGVGCGDCHDPHSLELRATGDGPDAVCANCHRPSAFATRAHHGHAERSPGASCVACHMPARTYMRVDARRDHSFRVPRPDLSAALDTPDACTRCHSDRDAAWASAALAERGAGQASRPHYGEALQAARSGAVNAESALQALIDDIAQPEIARATAASLLGPYLSAASIESMRGALRDASGIVRLGALRGAESVDPRARVAIARGLLRDPLRAVRLEAARILAGSPASAWRPADRSALADALAEYRASQHAVAERPEAWLNLGVLHAQLGELVEAERAQRRAVALAPELPAPYVNLADVLREQGREPEAEAVLREGLAKSAASAELRYALALSRVRSGQREDAIPLLREATEIAPAEASYAYGLALALHDAKRTQEAVAELVRAHEQQPANREILFALATLERDRGHREEALAWLRQLLDIDPSHRAATALTAELSGAEHTSP